MEGDGEAEGSQAWLLREWGGGQAQVWAEGKGPGDTGSASLLMLMLRGLELGQGQL